MSLTLHNHRIDGYVPVPAGQPVPTLKQTGEMVLPPGIDLRPMCSAVENQGDVGSCTANAVVGALEYWQIVNGYKLTDLSRLFVYYNARRMADQEGVDLGASMAHVMAALLAYGACAEAAWPYNEANWSVKPPPECYQGTLQFPGMHYARVSANDERKYVLATGLPIIFGMGVPEQAMMVEAARTGYLKAPDNGIWEDPKGGHAMLIVGYDDSLNGWIVRNSWGNGWGKNGHFLIDYRALDVYGQPDGYWTVGPLDKNRLFRMAGASTEESQQAVIDKAPSRIQDQIADVRSRFRNDMTQRLESTRDGLRDRLRGPGAGGGYEQGPGAGGGYEQGPGVGGGYEKGAGAGGGYEKGPGAGGGYDD